VSVDGDFSEELTANLSDAWDHVAPSLLRETDKNPVHATALAHIARPFLSGVHFVHAVLNEGPAILAFKILFVCKILACVHLVLLAGVAQRLDICSFADAALEEIPAIVPFQAFLVSQVVAGFHFVLLRDGRGTCLSSMSRCVPRREGYAHTARQCRNY
jgi:hypothetical protein